ncbi:MAG: GNAT family N-acetyltransferase, partial [Deltaproteobacteria bacterium]|nr:GNAT family N-acetyltransferase [Deltaproteobacteria bacterium]
MIYRQAKIEDSRTLAELNHQLIRDEGHWNPMTVPELENRMRDWLADVYRAIIFQGDEDILAYALYREDDTLIYLRQFFVIRNRRRQGIGRRAMDILRHE